MVLDFSDNASFKYLVDRDRYEATEVRAFVSSIVQNPGCCVLDIGANYGAFTLRAGELAKMGAVSHLIAVEPDRRPFAALARSLSRNGLSEVCQLFPVIVSDAGGSERLWVNRRSSADNRTHAIGGRRIRVRDTYEREACTVDGLLVRAGAAEDRDFVIKMDIQGNELRALRGMERVLEGAWTMYFEYSPSLLRSAGSDPEEFIGMVSAWEIDHAYLIEKDGLKCLDGRSGLIAAMREADRPDRRLDGGVADFAVVRGMEFRLARGPV